MKSLLAILLTLSCLGSYAQRDKDKLTIKDYRALAFKSTGSDSSVYFAKKSYELAVRQKSKKEQAKSLSVIATCYVFLNDNPSAFEYFLKSVEVAENVNDSTLIIQNLSNIGNIYYWNNDYQKALEYYLKAKVSDKRKMSIQERFSQNINIGTTYEKLGKLDSARKYVGIAYRIILNTNMDALKGNALLSLGNISFSNNKFQDAEDFYRKSFLLQSKSGNRDGLVFTSLGLAKLAHRKNQQDTVIKYARISYESSRKIRLLPEIEALDMIKEYFAKTNQVDSAYYYLQKRSDVKDSIASEDKIKRIENLSMNEKIRLKAKSDEERKLNEQRKYNLQVMGIGIFVISLILILVLLFHVKSSPKFIEVMGFICLLLMFEFIVFFLHPYIGHLTHHSPIWMFAILVLIAAVLVPLHHALEKLLKRRITRFKE